MKNTLYYGDNLDILRRYVKDETADLIYLDPPFKSDQDYNVLFAEQNGSRSKAQIRAFEDTWQWDQGSAQAFVEAINYGGRIADTMASLQSMLGENDMMAYLSMMAPRLMELRRVLKPSGSIYLHCDPTASHYLKMLMDAVFGPRSFRNEIVWRYTGWNKNLRYYFERRHDILLFYAKDENAFNSYSIPWKSEAEYVKVRKQKIRRDEKGRAYVLSDAGGGKRVPRYLDEAMKAGSPVDDVWDIDKLTSSSKERLSYPTQKPEALLERIIKASSNEGDLILDPFCGCGTTIAVAHRFKRQWIGIDITHLAINLIRYRFRTTFPPTVGDKDITDEYEVIGEPKDLPGAKALAQQDRYQFQWWALDLVGARPADPKRGADRGIDGRLYFYLPNERKTRQIVISVKSGKVAVEHVRDLRGVIEREGAEIGVLLTLRVPTRQMRAEAARAPFYVSKWGRHPRLQILTVAELLEGKRIDYPPSRQVNMTFKGAPRAKREQEQKNLL